MDPYEKLLDQARETARALVARGVAPRPYADDDGHAVDGWCIKQLHAVDRDHYRGPSDWEEFRSFQDLLLTPDGRFFTFLGTWSAGSRASEPDSPERTRYLKHESAQFLVALGPGKPFAAVSMMLERLPWTASSCTPPAAAPAPPRQAVSAPARPAPSPTPAAPRPAPPNAGGAIAGLAAGFFYGCVVGGIGAVVLGIALGMGGVADGDAVGITTMAFALASIVTCMITGAVQGGRRPAPSRRTGRPTRR